MKFGLTEPEYQYITECVVEPLRKNGLQVFCYGSRARGDFKRYSDLDLMIEGNSSEATQALKSKIEEKLTNENFPYKVELVFFEEFADSYKSNYQRDKKIW
ncbi:MAG: nucleotidyltransferase family protein [Bdellovibrionales bacterium]